MAKTHHDGDGDELTSATWEAIQSLPATRKASFLLDTSLALIESGQCVVSTCFDDRLIHGFFIYRYGSEVEHFLEVYLRTPHLHNHDLTRALLARGNARKAAGENLLAKAQQGKSEQDSVAVRLHHDKCRLLHVPLWAKVANTASVESDIRDIFIISLYCKYKPN